MLDHNASNKVSCTVCDWARVHDATREYRGGHTNPVTLGECHEQLAYTEISPSPMEVFFLGEPEAFNDVDNIATQQQLDDIADIYELDSEQEIQDLIDNVTA